MQLCGIGYTLISVYAIHATLAICKDCVIYTCVLVQTALPILVCVVVAFSNVYNLQYMMYMGYTCTPYWTLDTQYKLCVYAITCIQVQTHICSTNTHVLQIPNWLSLLYYTWRV
jgi:hypothetical protein